jgi:membrane-associated phospholipid phosphatase
VFRFVEASRVVREAVPPALVDAFALVTLLGGGPFLVVVLALAYWNLERREDALALISVAFVGLAVTVALKGGFDLPRPPLEMRRHPVEPGSTGFPSGHAISATVVYGGALVAFDRVRHRPSLLVAVGLVVAISVSRVVIGVHYLGDVIAGVAVGLVVLLAWVVVERNAVVTFGLAAVLSILAMLVVPGDIDAAIGLGGSLGGLAATRWNPETATLKFRFQRVAVNVAGIAVVGIAGIAETLVGGALPVVVAISFCLAFGIVVVPLAIDELDRPGRVTPGE